MADDLDQGWFSAETATFGDRVTGAREAAGMSQSDLARKLGVKLKTIQGWEDDMLEPRANRLQMLAGMLGVSIRWLLTGEGDGLDAPGDRAPLSSEAKAILTDMAALRTRMMAMSAELGQMEKRMRAALKETAE